jgi:carboxypeptidase family protein
VSLRSFLEELGKNVPEPGGVMKRLWCLLSLFGFVLLALCLFSGTSLQAQSTATLHGTVTDASGAAVPKATVTARNQATGIAWTTESNADGNYLFPVLPPGVYSIEVTREGFQKQIIAGLELDVASSVEQNVRLKVGEISQQVVITGETPVIDSSTMTVGQVINQATVQDIPLNGRHIEDLIELVPGSVTPPVNGFLTFPLRGLGSFGANTAGNREDTVNFLVNGINLNDMVQNQTTFQPSISTVSEFKVLNSTVSPQYGHTSGAIMSVATRPGTNDFHGELFEFIRNNALDAKNFFDNPTRPIPPFKRNNFGVDVGGPIWRNKAFFFYSFESLHQRQQITFNTQVPSLADRATVTDPVSLALLTLIPNPNVGSNRFAGSGSAPPDVNQNTLDLFANLTPSDQLHGYFARQRDDRHEPAAAATLPGFGDIRGARRNLLTLSWTHTFSSTLVDEFDFGGNRIKIKFGNLDTHDPASFGMVGQKAGALPLIQIQSLNLLFGGVGGADPQGRFDTTYVWGDTLSWLHGNHNWKFGTEIRKFFNNNFFDPVGAFVFSDFTCTSTTDPCFAAGRPAQFSIFQGSANNAVVTDSLGFLAQDSYKLRRNFTLEYGFRLEWNTTPTERFNRFAAVNSSSVNLTTRTASLAQINVTPGFNQLYGTAVNYMPRLGFAWDLFGTGKTVVRAGYGIFFDQPVTNSVLGLNANPPFQTPVLINGPPSFANPFQGTAVGGRPLNVTVIDPRFKDSYVQQWNLNFERQIGRSLGLTIGYYGSKGTHLRVNLNTNQPDLSLSACNTVTPPASGIAGLSSRAPVCFVQLLDGSFRPLNVLTDVASVSNSSYNGLWISANERLWHGMQFVSYYTYSHSIDNNSLTSSGTLQDVQDVGNIAGDRGSSDFDVRHRFVSSLIYDLPFRGRHAFLPSRFIEGWTADTIVTLQSGNPINITLAGANTGLTNVTATVRPNIIGNPNVAQQDPSSFFNPLAFAAPPSGQFGNLGRNVLVGPPFKDLDFAIHKVTPITERVKIEFRTEVFNLFNHPNFGNPVLSCSPARDSFTVSSLPGQTFPAGTCIPNASFGTITDTVTGRTLSSSLGRIFSTRVPTGDFGSARQLQFALKLQF